VTLLSDLMRKRAIATATVATPATQEGMEGLTVANVASVAVANRLFAEEEAAIRVWLAHIKETDPVIIAETMATCRSNPEALSYCLEQARLVLPCWREL
jgi:hypothetical protein